MSTLGLQHFNTIPKPSLSRRTTIAVAIALWQQKNVYFHISNLWISGELQLAKWSEIEEEVINNVPMLPLPPFAQEKVLNFIQPIGINIFKFLKYHFGKFHFIIPQSFCWTQYGKIDYEKTIKLVISAEDLNDVDHFKLASHYCIEREVIELFPLVGNDLYKEFIKNFSLFALKESTLVLYWAFYLKSNLDFLMETTMYCGPRTSLEYGLFISVQCQCESAVKYFSKRLSPNRVLFAIPRITNYLLQHLQFMEPSVLIFLLSQLIKELRTEVLLQYIYAVSNALLTWPFQEIFENNIHDIVELLSGNDYLNLLENIARYVSSFHRSGVYKYTFELCWTAGSDSLKKYVIAKCTKGSFLSRLFLLRETDDIIKLLFLYADCKEREEMLFHFEGLATCDMLIFKGKWESLKMFIQECISSKCALRKFQERYCSHHCTSNLFTPSDLQLLTFHNMLSNLKFTS